MIKLTKLTDYGIVLLTYMARDRERTLHTARDLADLAQVPLPTVSKVLKLLLQAELLVSLRGVKGGYSLSRAPQDITVTQIITALEGPIAVTECSEGTPGVCGLEAHCPVSNNWRIISLAVRRALEQVTLADLIYPMQVPEVRKLVHLEMLSGPTQ